MYESHTWNKLSNCEYFMKTVVKWLASWLNIDYEEKWGGGGFAEKSQKYHFPAVFDLFHEW